VRSRQAAGREPYEYALELMLQRDGRELLMFTHEVPAAPRA
jgi:hypothetical protein